MIPAFNETGVLPPGIHPAMLDEIDVRFGRDSELRKVQMESIRWMVDIARTAGVARIVLNGSFVTDTIDPNDVDCVLLVEPSFPLDAGAEAELRSGLPFLDIKLVRRKQFDLYVTDIFAYDRYSFPKGLVEVML